MRTLVSTVLAAVIAMGGIAVGGPAFAQTPVVSSAYTVEPFSPSDPIMIRGTGVRLRAEPFANAQTPVLSSGSTGMVLNVVGVARMSDWSWYQVVLRNGQKAFIRSDLTSAPMPGGARAAPVLQPLPPQPQPRATLPPQAGAITMTPQPNPAAVQPRATTPEPGLNLPLPSSSTAPQSNTTGNTTVNTTGHTGSNDSGLISIAPEAPAPRMPGAQPVAMSMNALVMSQLKDKNCWTDSSRMMDAQRLKATFSMSFGQDGRFTADPVLVDPPLAPADDPSMQVFIAKARAALRTCNALGFQIPQDYFAAGAREVRVEFTAR